MRVDAVVEMAGDVRIRLEDDRGGKEESGVMREGAEEEADVVRLHRPAAAALWGGGVV